MGRYLAAGALLLGAAIAAVIVIGSGGGSNAGAASAAKSSGSATVARRDLIQTDTEAGTLSFADSRTAYNRLSGTITSLPAAGAVVRPGGVLFTVNNAPVVLMDGTVPAYRSLSAGVADGPDVEELERNLVALGFDSAHAITVDQHFDSATTAAVDRWQASLGEAQTGTVTLGQVVFLPGPRRISTVSASVGSNGGSGGAGTGASTASLRLGAAHPMFVDLTSSSSTSDTTSTTTTTTSTTSSNGRTAPVGESPTVVALIALLRAEVAELKAAQKSAAAASRSTKSTGAAGSSGRSGAGSGAASGSGSGSGTGASSSGAGSGTAQAVLTTTSTQLVATVALDATKQSEAVLGEPVTVQMPDGSTVDGRISRVAAAAQAAASSGNSGAGAGSGGSGSGSGASSTVPVTITLRGHRRTAGLDQAAVSVNFEQQKALHVLSVPVTALLATAGGSYAVQEVAAPHRLIPVTPGLFAAGYVQISGSGIFDGLAVTDSQG